MSLTDYLDQIDAASQAMRAELTQSQPAPPPVDQTTVVKAGGNLQAALDAGGVVQLEDGAVFQGNFVMRTNGTQLIGTTSAIAGGAVGPGLTIAMGTRQMKAATTVTSDGRIAFIVGDNDTTKQKTLQDVPDEIELSINVPFHRRKVALAICGSHVRMLNCGCADVYDASSATEDSEGIAIINTPGPVDIIGGEFSAGSEVILLGGAASNWVPTDVTVDNVKLWRPLSWRTDGVYRKVKNLFEVKTGIRVALKNSVLDGSWNDAQDGYALVVTPHSGGDIHDVTFDNLDIRNVAAILQILGQEYATGAPPTPSPTSGVRLLNSRCKASVSFGALGVASGITGAPNDVYFDGNEFTLDGTRIVGYDSGNVLAADGTKKFAGPMTLLSFTNNKVAGGMKYSFMLQGVANAGPTQQGATTLMITGNTFADASSALKKYQPENTYVDRATFDALLAAGASK